MSADGERLSASSGLRSANDLEGSLTPTAEPEDGEIIIERRDPKDTESLHHCEARTVDDREVLIRECFADHPGCLEITIAHWFDARGTTTHGHPDTHTYHART